MTTELFSITADRPEQETLPLFAVARESDVKNVGMREQNLLSLSYGNIVRKDINSADGLLPASFETYQIVEPGMTILRFTDLQNDQRSLRSGLVTERGIITSAYVAVDAFAMDPRFFAYMMRAYDTNKVFYGMGGGVRQGLNFDSIRRLPVPNLPLDEQRAIADYLDQETAQIDALVAKQEEFIGLLRERKSVVLDSVFAADRYTQRTTVGRLLGARPSYGVLVPRYVDEASAVPFVRVGDLHKFQPNMDLPRIPHGQCLEYRRTRLEGGEVLLGVVGRMGIASVVPEWLAGANVARAVAVLRLKDPQHADLLSAWLGSGHFLRQAVAATSGDSVQPTLGMTDLAHFELHWPIDPAQAKKDLKRLDDIDALIVKAEEHITLANERRSALITAAVTGQFDVRTATKGTRV